MKATRAQISSLVLIFIAFAAAAALYSRLPEAMPTHWDASGIADGFTPKPWGPFVLPLAMLGTFALLSVLPLISPRGYDIARFRGVFDVVSLSLVGFLFLVHVLALMQGLGFEVPMRSSIGAGAGLLIVVVGNFMGKMRRNFFIGIRTPWTLASEEVWLRTHRLGGKTFVMGGALMAAEALFGAGSAAVLTTLGIAAGIPVVYSFVIYRRLEGKTVRPSEA
jgi:uncharacterized membrane protein